VLHRRDIAQALSLTDCKYSIVMKKFIAENQCLFLCLGSLMVALGGAITTSIVEHQLTLKHVLQQAFIAWGFCCTAFVAVYDKKKRKPQLKQKDSEE